MPNTSRKAIANALLAKLAPTGGPFPVSGRRIVDPENVAQPGAPALFLIKPNEKIAAPGEGQPPERGLRFAAVIYTNVGTSTDGGDAAVPADVIDDLVDYVTNALATDAAGNPLFASNGRQPLGGSLGVYDCVIDGDVMFFPGDQTGKGQTVVPIKVTLGQYP
jgi:hypothetical protein